MFEELKKKLALKKIKKYNDIEGWLTEPEALGLYKLAKKLPAQAIIVEIGSWKGKSTFCLARGLKSGYVFAIDPFNGDGGLDTNSQAEYDLKKGSQDLLTNFENTMQRLGVDKKIVAKKGYSSQFHKDFNKIDLLFIDGDHSIKGCQSDFELYAPKIKSGGYIAFHDYYKNRSDLGPTFVIKNLVNKSEDFIFYELVDSLWIGKKK